MDLTMRVTSCPYCRGGTGVIQVDAWPLLCAVRRGRDGSELIPIDWQLGQQVILFGSELQRRPPCDHLVYLSVELTAGDQITDHNYLHPELGLHDADQLVLGYLRDAFAEGVDCGLDEETRYSIREIASAYYSHESGDALDDKAATRLRAWVIFAEDAETFAAEVQAAARSRAAETAAP